MFLLASRSRLRSDYPVRKWFNRRSAIHLGIAALFIVLMIGLILSPSFYNYSPFVRWIKIHAFDSLEDSTIDQRVTIGRKAQVSPEIVFDPRRRFNLHVSRFDL